MGERMPSAGLFKSAPTPCDAFDGCIEEILRELGLMETGS
jgi:hypothetical protein